MARDVTLYFAASALLLCAGESTADSAPSLRSAENVSSDDGMIFVPAGDYRVFFKRPNGIERVPVEPFYVDAAPVTKRQYLEFVRLNPQWRKSATRALVAEPTYLSDWSADLHPQEHLDAPVTFVSWFGARAYCNSQGRRLPTVAQWERFAGETSTTAALSEGAPAHAVPFQFAMGRTTSDLRDAYVQFASIWEWTDDFNSAPSLVAAGASPSDNPRFCGDGFRSNNAVDYAAFLRFSFRSSLRANYALKNLGFRCVR